MPNATELELAIREMEGDQYELTVTFRNPRSHAVVAPARGSFALDLETLFATQSDPAAYGKALSDAVFSDSSVRSMFERSRAASEALGLPMRVRLRLEPSAARLHGVRWELMQDPDRPVGIATSQRVRFSRFLASSDGTGVELRERGRVRAAIGIAAPAGLDRYGLAEIDGEGERRRARAALDRIETDELHFDLEHLLEALQGGIDILYLVCHGAFGKSSDPGDGSLPSVFLQGRDGGVERVLSEDFAARFRELEHPPRLVVLASCESSGTGRADDGGRAFQTALAPLLVEAGVPAVIAMQGTISMVTIEQMMPVFFRELQRHGHVERAMAAARSAVWRRDDSWMPVLYSRLKDGRIWLERAARPSKARRDQLKLLQKVRESWIDGVLRRSLDGRQPIDVPLRSCPEVLPESTGPLRSEAFPKGLGAAAVFEGCSSMVILGERGAGKTIALLGVAQELTDRALESDVAPIPVVLNLASWRANKGSFTDWVAGEIQEKYLIPKGFAVQWLQAGDLVLLLDGLDETRLEHRNACCAVLNGFIEGVGEGVEIVVCCRWRDYRAIPPSERLRVESAITLEPLKADLIGDYLAQRGQRGAALRRAIADDDALHHAAATPLMLDLIATVYEDGEGIEDAVLAGEDGYDRLLLSFVDQRFALWRAGSLPYAKADTLEWLSWLARSMREHAESVLMIERIQPSWLPRSDQRRHGIGFGLIWGQAFGVMAIVFWWVVEATVRAPVPEYPGMELLVATIAFGTLVGLLNVRRPRFLFPQRMPRWDKSRRAWLTSGRQDLTRVVAYGALWSLLVTLNVLVWWTLTGGAVVVDGALDPALRQLIGRSVMSGVPVWALVGVFLGGRQPFSPKIDPAEALRPKLGEAMGGIVFGLISGLVAGGVVVALSEQRSWQALLALLIPCVLVGGAYGTVIGAMKSHIQDSKTGPNQGLRLSTDNGLFAGRSAAGIIAVVVIGCWPMAAFSGVFQWDLSAAISVAAILALSAFLGTFFWLGGLERVKQFLLFKTLHDRGEMAPDFLDWLDHVADLGLLERVGGGYLFAHRMLLEFFADRPLPGSAQAQLEAVRGLLRARGLDPDLADLVDVLDQPGLAGTLSEPAVQEMLRDRSRSAELVELLRRTAKGEGV